MKYAIAEDNPLAYELLSKMLSKFDFLKEISLSQSIEENINTLNNQKPDLLFLDMELDGVNGIDFLDKLRFNPMVIAVTAHKDFAPDAFDKNFVDYIVKPVQPERLALSLIKAKDRKFLENGKSTEENSGKIKPEYIFVRSNSVLTKIRVNEIDYVQAAGDYVNIYTKSKRYTVHITLRGLEEKLPEGKFYRLHRSYLVSLDQVDVVEEGTAYLDKHPIPIGEQYKKELLRRLNLI